MSATIINVSRGKSKASSGEQKTIFKRVRRQISARVFSRTVGGQKSAKSVLSQDVTTTTPTVMAAKVVGHQAGTKRKDKVVDAGRLKEASSPLRRTRSRTLGLSKDTDNSGAPGPPTESGKSNAKQHVGVENRKRSREAIIAPGSPTPKKSSVRIRSSRFSPNLARITEEKSGSPSEDEATIADDRSATPLEDETAPRPSQGTPRPTGSALRRKVTTALQRRAVGKDLHKKAAREKETVKKAVAKESPTIAVNLARAKTTPLPGLQELRRSTRSSNTPKQSRPAKLLETTDSTNEQEDIAVGQETIVDNDTNVRVTRSKITTNALRVAEDATGFVRAAMNAVAEARMKEEQQRSKKSVGEVSAAETVSKDESQSKKSRSNSNGSNRSRKGLTAEKLIQELDSYRLPTKPGGMDMKEKLRKGISRLTRSHTKLSKQQDNSPAAMKKAATPTKLPRVANQENLPKATESALVRRLKNDIEDHAKKYGLLDQEKPVVPPGRAGRKGPLSPGGLEQQGSGSGPPEDGSQNDWTPEQEIALQNAYITVKPAADFWYHISKRVPGKTTDECFNKFYAGHPTPPGAGAQRQKRQSGNVAADDTDFLANANLKRRTARGKQRLLEAHRTIRTILRKQQVDDEEYEADAFEALERADVVGSVLNSEEANEAVIFRVTEVPATYESKTDSNSKPFENIVIGGLSTSDKENRNVNAAGSEKGSRILPDSQAQLSSPEVLKVVKDPRQLDKYIDHLHQRHHTRRGRTTATQKPVKKSNVYLHSKEALDLGENTLTAIQRAKEELRNVFLKSGAAGASFLDIMGPGEEEGQDGEEEREGEFSSDGDG